MLTKMRALLTIYIVCLIVSAYLSYLSAENETYGYIPKSRQWKYIAWFTMKMHRLSTALDVYLSWLSTPSLDRRRYQLLMKEGKKLQEKYKRRRIWSRSTTLAFWAMAMQAKAAYATQPETHFDTDSGPLGIDNRCSGCISSFVEDFEGPLQESGRVIKGFGGTRTRNVMTGTIIWNWLDENGAEHKFSIPNSYFGADTTVEPSTLGTITSQRRKRTGNVHHRRTRSRFGMEQWEV